MIRKKRNLSINPMQVSMNSFLIVGLGGGMGAMSRYGISVLANHLSVLPFLSTLFANMFGCFLMGVIFQLINIIIPDGSNELLVEQNRLFFAVGFCGSFTTLSAVAMETKQMLDINQYIQSFIYLFGTMFGMCFHRFWYNNP